MPDLTIKKSRPVWYNLSPLNLPIPGLVSIFHRISGLLLVFGLPWLLYLLDLSLGSEAGFEHLRGYMTHPLLKAGILIVLWAFLHHLCAGIRYLLLDLHVGIALPAARVGSFIVFAVSLAATAVFGVMLW